MQCYCKATCVGDTQDQCGWSVVGSIRSRERRSVDQWQPIRICALLKHRDANMSCPLCNSFGTIISEKEIYRSFSARVIKILQEFNRSNLQSLCMYLSMEMSTSATLSHCVPAFLHRPVSAVRRLLLLVPALVPSLPYRLLFLLSCVIQTRFLVRCVSPTVVLVLLAFA